MSVTDAELSLIRSDLKKALSRLSEVEIMLADAGFPTGSRRQKKKTDRQAKTLAKRQAVFLLDEAGMRALQTICRRFGLRKAPAARLLLDHLHGSTRLQQMIGQFRSAEWQELGRAKPNSLTKRLIVQYTEVHKRNYDFLTFTILDITTWCEMFRVTLHFFAERPDLLPRVA